MGFFMLFNKVKFFKINKDFPVDESSLTKSLEAHLFTKIDKTQMSTQGFVNPFTHYADKPVYGMSGTFMVTLREDSKSIPAAAVKRKANLRIKELEKSKGEKASKDEKIDIKDQVLSEMCSAFPHDFVKDKYISAIIFPKEKLIAIDSVSDKDCELILTMLRTSIGTLPVIEFESDSIPTQVMTDWLKDESSVPDELNLLQECQLKDELDDGGAVATFKNQELNCDEIEGHLDAGKVASIVAVEWNDSLKFKIREDLTIHGVSYTDFVKDRLKDDSGEGAPIQKFDAEVALTVENLRMLAPNLLEIFG